MPRVSRTIAVAIVVGLSAMSPQTAVAQDGGSGWHSGFDSEPVFIDSSAFLQGGYDHGDLGDGWPCPTYNVDAGTPEATEAVGIRRSGPQAEVKLGGAVAERTIDGVVQRQWHTWCERADGSRIPFTFEFFWVGFPTPANLVPAVYERVVEELAAPTPQWQFVDEFSWLYVHTPMTLRITNLAPINATATVSNIFGTATASVTATPVEVVFTTDPVAETDPVACSIPALRQPYVPGEGCTVAYRHSSAITDDDHFGYTLTVRWDVVSEPPRPGLGTTLETSFTDRIQVAEVQAVVTCQGSGC